MARPKNTQKIFEIDRVIAHLFARKGYQRTSMRDIAHELGMNQASLYYYYKSKEEMLFRLMNGAMEDSLLVIEDICASDLSPEDKLSQVLSFYSRYFAGEQEREILLLNEMNSLNDQHRNILNEKQRHYVQLFYSILQELTDQNKMKPIDHTVATFAFFGMVHYTVRWYNRDGPINLEELANMFVEIFTRGIFR
ncbi:Transcriptional regulator, TetR family [uncultured Desulfatiglans sp.]|uniref:Transcriptional regulator, TetR family n=1 Tax=Uncultured Desulfatiglans sp. TaxID=1748965 RepID=A0A653AAP0_UNCDX|nr:Transcriptional regulator, TetR family [uncultured Desulfatiglans sp.]